MLHYLAQRRLTYIEVGVAAQMIAGHLVGGVFTHHDAPRVQANAIAARTPTTSLDGPVVNRTAGCGGGGVHARHPRIHAAIPCETTNATARPPWRTPPSVIAPARISS